MHAMWEYETPQQRFWKRLVRQRAESHMQDAKYLQALRHRNDLAKADQKLFGHIWAEHNTNIYKLIAKAHGENWDAEDEQKTAYALHEQKKTAPIPQRENDNLVAAREASTRGGEHLLQGEPEESEQELEKGRKEEEGKGACRRGGFYRAAGGT